VSCGDIALHGNKSTLHLPWAPLCILVLFVCSLCIFILLGVFCLQLWRSHFVPSVLGAFLEFCSLLIVLRVHSNSFAIFCFDLNKILMKFLFNIQQLFHHKSKHYETNSMLSTKAFLPKCIKSATRGIVV
jgi:ABC-type branched-subunit amino acid transport system permease subunit